jgi:hypothetical protein
LTTRTSGAAKRGPLPGRIVSYDRTTQRADVEPLVFPRGQALPIVRDVPIVWPRGAAGSITIDLSAGDFVELVPSEVDVSAWSVREVKGEAPTQRTYDLADCVAIPGLGTLVSKLGSDAVASGAIVIAGASILLGSSAASDFVALASKVLTELGNIKTAFDAHIHPTPAGPSSPPTIPMPAPGSVAATKVKGE